MLSLATIKKALGLNIETYVGYLQKPISIYAHKNDEKLWNESANTLVSCSVFSDPPVLYIIESQDSHIFTFVPNRSNAIKCVLDRNINVYHNNCIVRQAVPDISTSFKGVLNYPVELVLDLDPEQLIRIKGFWEQEVFHITAISNYPIL